MGSMIMPDFFEYRGLDADLRACLDAVAGFADVEISRRWRSPDCPLTPTDFSLITAAATQCGLLDVSADGAGLWHEVLRVSDHAFSVQALRCLARHHTAVAFHLHCRALARVAGALAGVADAGLFDAGLPAADGSNVNRSGKNFPDANDAVFLFAGSYGLGRSALIRELGATALSADDQALLEDSYGLRTRILPLADVAAPVLVPMYAQGEMQLAFFPAQHALRESDAQPHGLDGLQLVSWRPCRAPLWSAPLTALQVTNLLSAFLLGLVAIALGASERAAQRATDYVTVRVQGGRRIIQHDAVALLMMEQEVALQATASRLADVARRSGAENPAGLEHLAAVLGLKLEALPLLCKGVNATMQVHGGSGYMRDTGVENVLRDLSCLRVLGGTPDELALMLATLKFSDAGQLESGAATFSAAANRTAGNKPAAKIADEKLQSTLTRKTLPGFVATDNALSPQTAFQTIPLLRWLAGYKAQPAWQRDTAELPAALRDYRQQLRDFAQSQLRPPALALDVKMKTASERPAELDALLREAGRTGLLSDLLPRPFGSTPLLRFRHSLAWQQALRTEELARADGGLMLHLSAHNLGLAPVLFSGNVHAYRRVVLPALRACEAGEPQIFAFAITEPGAGSDAEDGHGAELNKPGLVATPVSGGWRLRGRKVFISGGDIARWVVAFAALAGEGFESWTAFLVDTTSAGFHRVRNEHKMGMRASAATELEFDDCFVPEQLVLGGVRKGWALNRATLNFSRLPVAAMAVGFAQQATDLATDFVCRMTMAGHPLIHYQNVQLALADMQAETAAIRALVWQYAKAWTPWQARASIAKFYATDRAQKVIERGMNLLGEHSLLHASEMEKAFRDNRLTRIFEGTNQINRLAVIEDQQDLLLARITEHRHCR